MFFPRKIIFIVVPLLLAGCQKNASQPVAENQLKQLSALVGASQFLREKCNRADIPADNFLTKAAFSEAAKKGWSVQGLDQGQLQQEARGVFSQLNSDPTPLQEKCRSFNRSLASFLAQAH